MSVLKAMRKESKVEYVDNALKLQVQTIKICLKIPKRYTFFGATEIARLAMEVTNCVKSCNSIFAVTKEDYQKRVDLLTDANCALQSLNSQMSVISEYIIANPKQYGKRESTTEFERDIEEWCNLFIYESKLISNTKRSIKNQIKEKF